MMRRSWFKSLAVFLAIWSFGCGQRVERADPVPFDYNPIRYVLIVVIDLSGSFHGEMAENGQGYQYVLKLIDSYFTNRIGEEDRLIIAQISGSRQPILFQGTPAQFLGSFPGPTEFRRFLLSRADPAGSRVHDSISDAVEETLHCPEVVKGQTRIGLCVFSDMEENASGPRSMERLTQNLKVLSQHKSFVAIYRIDRQFEALWRATLSQCGFDQYHGKVVSGSDANIQLPKF